MEETKLKILKQWDEFARALVTDNLPVDLSNIVMDYVIVRILSAARMPSDDACDSRMLEVCFGPSTKLLLSLNEARFRGMSYMQLPYDDDISWFIGARVYGITLYHNVEDLTETVVRGCIDCEIELRVSHLHLAVFSFANFRIHTDRGSRSVLFLNNDFGDRVKVTLEGFDRPFEFVLSCPESQRRVV